MTMTATAGTTPITSFDQLDVSTLLTELTESGARLWVQEGRLRIQGADLLPATRVTEIRARREEIIRYLSSRRSGPASARATSLGVGPVRTEFPCPMVRKACGCSTGSGRTPVTMWASPCG